MVVGACSEEELEDARGEDGLGDAIFRKDQRRSEAVFGGRDWLIDQDVRKVVLDVESGRLIDEDGNVLGASGALLAYIGPSGSTSASHLLKGFGYRVAITPTLVLEVKGEALSNVRSLNTRDQYLSQLQPISGVLTVEIDGVELRRPKLNGYNLVRHV